jgi:PadR family transcriptional regulator PadR
MCYSILNVMANNEDGDINSKKIQMKKGLLEFCILLAIGKKESYASDIIAELKKSDLIVVEGTLYPLLSRIKNAGLIQYSWVESEAGPPRKYYTLTEKGKQVTEELKITWEDLAKSVNSLTKNI